ncbi:MAG TPA: hypothetical protein VFQ53_36330 [Kofleriaceae bacterium]|nr:hypothetical protein [Kofleriaceae bacterium]
MKIDTLILLPIAAVVSSILLLMAGKKRIFELIAVIASAVWLTVQLGVIRWPIKQASEGLVIGATLLICGLVVYLATNNKREVTASTVLSILGGVLLLTALKALG